MSYSDSSICTYSDNFYQILLRFGFSRRWFMVAPRADAQNNGHARPVLDSGVEDTVTCCGEDLAIFERNSND